MNLLKLETFAILIISDDQDGKSFHLFHRLPAMRKYINGKDNDGLVKIDLLQVQQGVKPDAT